MKKLILAAVILLSCLTFKNADAQLHVSLGLNIGSQPEWGPVGYDHADYYYIPDVGAYYDVNAHQYIYLENNVWVHRGYLPTRYRNYDLYHGYKVVVNDRDPWMRDGQYRSRYAQFRGRHDQAIIRNSRDDRYRNHWQGAQQNQRDQHLDQRAQHLNQRDNHLDQREHQENQRGKQLNQRDQHQDQKGHDEKKDDHHDH